MKKLIYFLLSLILLSACSTTDEIITQSPKPIVDVKLPPNEQLKPAIIIIGTNKSVNNQKVVKKIDVKKKLVESIRFKSEIEAYKINKSLKDYLKLPTDSQYDTIENSLNDNSNVVSKTSYQYNDLGNIYSIKEK